MAYSNAFTPVVDPATNTQTCVQVTTATAGASTKIKGNEVLITCLTNPAYVRLGKVNSAAVSATNGYYMAIGAEVRWRPSRGADYLQYIRGSGTDGALSIAYGTGD